MNKFLDFDKEEQTFYNNIFLDDYKIVVKMPIEKGRDGINIKIEEFSLANHVYLLSYE